MLLAMLKRVADAWSSWQGNRYDPAKHYMRGPGPKCEMKRSLAHAPVAHRSHAA